MEEPSDADSLPVCDSHEGIEPLDGQRVVVHGTYQQVDVRKRRPGDDSEPVYRGYAVLRFDDGHAVFLEPTWSAEAVRPSEEIEALEGKPARAIGTLHHFCPPPPEPVAAITNPCLTDVEDVWNPNE